MCVFASGAVCIYVCVSVCRHKCLCVSLCMYMFLCIYACTCVCLGICGCVSVSESVHTCTAVDCRKLSMSGLGAICIPSSMWALPVHSPESSLSQSFPQVSGS